MIIGVPKEIKLEEYRIALTPEAVERLTKKGHTVLVEKSAGEGALFDDAAYQAAGADIAASHGELFASSELIVKVKEPLPEEYGLLQQNHVLFAYLHLASSVELTKALSESKATAIAFETVQTSDGKLPLLAPMSEIAGRLSVLEGAKCLQRPFGGLGKLLATFDEGESAPKVVIIGAGVAGVAAAKVAAGLGADITILDIAEDKLQDVKNLFGEKVTAVVSTPETIRECAADADLLICAVLLAGARAPHLVTREHLKLMKKRSVVVDIAVDQGGCIETSRPTTHSDPVFECEGIIHYCVANMPGCVPVTSTTAISNAIAPYVEQLADKGWRAALRDDPALAQGLNVYNGNVTCKVVADLFDLPHVPIEEVLQEE